MNILLVGLGSIGKRHLEGAINSKIRLDIYIYDIKFDSELDSFDVFRIENLNKLKCLSIKFDLVIVSTTINERFATCKRIIELISIKNLILEKFVFKTLYQYQIFNQIIKKKKINTYINCPRRNYDIYKYLKKKFFRTKSNKINISINLDNFGLLSNSIHIIDLLLYLKGKNINLKKMNVSQIKVKKTKRKKFFDISGTIQFNFNDNGSSISISDNSSKNYFKIFLKNKIFHIRETENLIVFNDNTIKFNDNLYQSTLTSKYIYSLSKKEKINLPKYESLLQVHKQFISYITRNNKLKKVNFT